MANHEYKEIWDTAINKVCLLCKGYCVRATPTGNMSPDQLCASHLMIISSSY